MEQFLVVGVNHLTLSGFQSFTLDAVENDLRLTAIRTTTSLLPEAYIETNEISNHTSTVVFQERHIWYQKVKILYANRNMREVNLLDLPSA